MQETPPSPAEPVSASPTPVENPEGTVPPSAEAPAAMASVAETAETTTAPEAPEAPETPEAAEAPGAEAPAQATAAPAVPDLSPAACAAALAERFPALFAAVPPLPIKLRIQADLQERAPGVFSRKSLSLFLHRYTTSTAYIRALVQAQTRFDLDGQPAGEIATEHREAAVLELERRKAIVMAKRQAERAAMRPPQPAQPQGGPAVEGEARPPRPPRPPRRDGPPRPERSDHAPRPDRHARPPRPGAPMQPRPDRPGRPDWRDGPPREPRPPRAAEPPRDSTPPGPDAEARRSRALLLRAFETSTISRANFCVLKRLSDAELEAQLQQARAERGEQRGDHGPAAAPRAAERPRR
jgi:ProP effector